MSIIVKNVKPDGNGYIYIKQLRGDGVTVKESATGVLSVASVTGASENFTPTEGQTKFFLTAVPVGEVFVYINGLLQDPSEFTLQERLLCWVSQNFSLAPSDRVDVLYRQG